jgi:hypothetical protein
MIEKSIDAIYKQINTCCNNVDTYIPSILTGVNAARVTELKKIRTYLGWTIDRKAQFHKISVSWTAFGQFALHGHGTLPLGVPPGLPVIPPVPPAPANADFAKYFSDFAASCKDDAGYNKTIGEAMDIVDVAAPFDPAVGKPALKIALHANHPFLHYHRFEWQGAAVYLDLHDGNGFKKIDTTPDPHYTDMLTPLPGSGVTQTRTYKIIYWWHGAEAGSMSDPVTITLVGA